MPTDQEQRPRSSLAVWLIAAVLLSPIAYLLSVGPAVWLYNRGYVGPWLAALYVPIDFVREASSPIRRARDWYISFWT